MESWPDLGDADICSSMVAPSIYIFGLMVVLSKKWNNTNLGAFPKTLAGIDPVYLAGFHEAVTKEFWNAKSNFTMTFTSINKIKHNWSQQIIESNENCEEADVEEEIQDIIFSILLKILHNNINSNIKKIKQKLVNWGIQLMLDLLPCYRHIYGMLGRRIFIENKGIIKFMKQIKQNKDIKINDETWKRLFALQNTEIEVCEETKRWVFSNESIHFEYGTFETNESTTMVIDKRGHINNIVERFVQKGDFLI